jgi:hypothetical protein
VVIFTTPGLGIEPKSFDIGSQVVLSRPVIDLPLKKPKKRVADFCNGSLATTAMQSKHTQKNPKH